MRWEDPEPRNTRVVKKFLLLPVKINGETRWLETACIMQRAYHRGWVNHKFIDEDKL